jgi:hypothetical protein
LENQSFPYLEAELKENIFDLRHRLLIIDNKFISYADKIMTCEDIKEIRYGSMQMLVFHRLKTEKYYKIDLKDKKGDEIKIFFGHSKLSEGDGQREENFDKIINSLWHAVKKRLVNEALDNIESGSSFIVGDCNVGKEGVRYPALGIGKKKELFIPWSDVTKKIGYGKFYIYSKKQKYRKCKINFLHTWNSVVLFTIIEYFLKKSKEKT